MSEMFENHAYGSSIKKIGDLPIYQTDEFIFLDVFVLKIGFMKEH